MTWVGATGFARRPLVVVEDHLHHVSELLEVLSEAETRQTTVVCLDRPGPDTTRITASWLERYPGLQVVARTGGSGVDPAVFEEAHRYCKTVAGMLRPGGLLLQDIQLATLGFIPPDRWWESIYLPPPARWWESIYLANTVRGMFAGNPPACRFLSNKRGYEATFGRDLLDAGFDPRDVMDKAELRQMVVPVVRSSLDRAFPLALQVPGAGEAWVAKTEEDRREVESELDLVVWQGSGVEIGGRLLAAEGRRLSCKAGSQEAVTWIE